MDQATEQLELVQQIYTMVAEFLVQYSFQVVGAIFILIAGFIVARWVSKLVVRVGERRDIDVTLRLFLASIARLLVLMFFIVIALSNFGITVTPFVAAIGAMAFGLSLAVQGPVSNYGAGVAIIIGRPFTVGNTITLKEFTGVVEEVKLAATVLVTEDGERITIPNKFIMGEVLTNSFEHKVVEVVIGIDYASDLEQAIAILRRALAEVDGVTQEPRPQIGIQGFGDSSIDIGLRFWVPTERYYETQYAANMAAWKALAAGGIQIPFPRRDLRVLPS
jgi:small conductance mechanosensitive channel